MAKYTNIRNIIKSHPDLTSLQSQIDTMETVQAKIRDVLPKTIQNKVEIVLATPKKLTIFAGNQIISAKIRQMSPTVLRHIKGWKGCEMVETLEIRVVPTDNPMPHAKRPSISHTESTLDFIAQMKKKLFRS